MTPLAGEGTAFKTLSPDNWTAPLVFDSPHSGSIYPGDFETIQPRDLLRQAEDMYIDELFGGVTEAGAPLLSALFPRAYIDANRGLHEFDPAVVDAPWPGPVEESKKTDLGIGLIWRKCRPNNDLYARKLTVAEAQARIDGYWWPYHKAFQALLGEAQARFGAVWHLNCHSMPELAGVLSNENPKDRRPEVCLGDRHGTTCAPAFTEFVRETLEDLGYQVAVNKPYAGVELVRAYSNPDAGRHSLQIELRRDLYMNEVSFERTNRFPQIAADMQTLAERMAAKAGEWLQQ